MKLIRFECAAGNFGDDLNDWIWDHLIPGWRGWQDDVTLLGVGTLINKERIKQLRGERVLVLGTGVGYGTRISAEDIPYQWDVMAVRGPESARLIGVPPECGLLDPAMLVADFPEFSNITRSGEVVFVPHWRSVKILDWERLCKEHNVAFVSPSGDARSVIKEIASARMVIAESMHAAIIAESFRIPWIPLSVGGDFNAAKWRDVFLSAGLRMKINHMTEGINRAENRFHFPRGRRYQRLIWDRVRGLKIERSFERVLNTEPVLGDDQELIRRKRAYYSVCERARERYS